MRVWVLGVVTVWVWARRVQVLCTDVVQAQVASAGVGVVPALSMCGACVGRGLCGCWCNSGARGADAERSWCVARVQVLVQ
jgi:hypothetical protein